MLENNLAFVTLALFLVSVGVIAFFALACLFYAIVEFKGDDYID